MILSLRKLESINVHDRIILRAIMSCHGAATIADIKQEYRKVEQYGIGIPSKGYISQRLKFLSQDLAVVDAKHGKPSSYRMKEDFENLFLVHSGNYFDILDKLSKHYGEGIYGKNRKAENIQEHNDNND